MKLSEIMALETFRFEVTKTSKKPLGTLWGAETKLKPLSMCICEALGIAASVDPPAGSELAFCCPIFLPTGRLELLQSGSSSKIVLDEVAKLGIEIPPGVFIIFVCDIIEWMAYARDQQPLDMSRILSFVRAVEEAFEAAGIDNRGRRA